MPCNCGKKKQSPSAEDVNPLLIQEPPEWGPVLWTYLHSLAERLGTSGSTIVDTDQANYLETMIQLLPLILPCTDCQQHAAQYLAVHPLPTLKGQYGITLRVTARQWLYDFHQDIRQRKEQPVVVASAEECASLYHARSLAKADYQRFIQTVANAVKQGWVRMDHWRKWFSASEKLRILSGNLVV